MIKHHPIFKIKQVEHHYSQKDGVPIKYVCTTELPHTPTADIYYRDTPHPKYENKYFALYTKYEEIMITNADNIETLTFALIENDNKQQEYSTHRHDYKKFNNGNMIDGGRTYIKHTGKVQIYVVRNGTLVPQQQDHTK